jgi:hypothetical protein
MTALIHREGSGMNRDLHYFDDLKVGAWRCGSGLHGEVDGEPPHGLRTRKPS